MARESEKISRRKYLKYAAVGTGLAVAAGAGYFGGDLVGYQRGYKEGLEAGVPPPPKPKVLIAAIPSEATTLDPAMHRVRQSESVCRLITDGLIWRDNKMNLIPDLAESYEALDEVTWRFKLRKGVKWHDGTEFTAEDAKYSLDRILDPETKSPRRSMIVEIESTEVVDKYTLVVKTKTPFALFPIMINHQQMVPKHYMEEVGSEGFVKAPIGTGAFKFVEWVKGERMVFEKNPDYWGGPPQIPPVGPPRIDKLVIRLIPETATRVGALKTGEIHWTYRVPVAAAEELKKDPNIVVEAVDSTRTAFCAMNTYKAPFDDIRVRHALNYAVDKDAIIKTVLRGYGIKVACMSFPGMIGYNPDLKPFPYDPEKAKSLLAEAGYPDGFEAEIFAGVPEKKDEIEAMMSYLLKVGVRTKLKFQEWSVSKEMLMAKEGDMWWTTWGAAEMDLTGNTNSTFCREKDTYAFQYHNPELTELMKKARATVDADERAKIYFELERKLQQDAPAIWLYEDKMIYAWRADKVVNYIPRADERWNFWDVVPLE